MFTLLPVVRIDRLTPGYRWAALLVWAIMASTAVAGFAAFSAAGTPHPTTGPLGRAAGSLAGSIFRAPGSLAPTRAQLPLVASRWTSAVQEHFSEPDVDRALTVVFCESSGDPDAINGSSRASGLFQHLPEFWEERSSRAGVGGISITDPDANIAVAAWLVYEGGGWRHWSPSAHCWGPELAHLG